METLFDVDRYNNLPLFSDALLSSEARSSELTAVGEALVGTGLHERFGIILLHRHFSLRRDEHPVRFNGRFASFSFIRTGEPPGGEPIAWMFSCEAETWHPIEYAATRGECPPIEAREFSRLQGQLGEVLKSRRLGRTFGLIDLAGISVHGQGASYELSHDGLRLSMLSRWRDSAHRQLTFSQSIWSFVRQADGIAVDNATKCEMCPNCQPGSTVRYRRDDNIFELGVRHSYLEEAPGAVTVELLDRLDRAVGQHRN
jgi:hypothetical protein